MIEFKNHYKSEKYSMEPISLGFMFMSDGRFRGVYLKLIFPTIEVKDIIDDSTFERINTKCKKHSIFRISLIGCSWKNIKLFKCSYWMPI